MGPRTLAEALAASYANNPTLQASRAQLRATDENVPQALAGWRPTVVLSGTGGVRRRHVQKLPLHAEHRSGHRPDDRWWPHSNQRADRLLGTAQATITQPLYTRRPDPRPHQPGRKPGDGAARPG